MRKILKSTNEVMHFWANKVQGEGRAGNVFFNGDKVYSYGYHFCIARHLPNGVVVFTTRKYSLTTSHHVSYARSAANHLQRVFCNDPDKSALDNKKAALDSINDLLTQSGKPRIHEATREKLKGQALHEGEKFNTYLTALPESESKGVEPIDLSNLEAVRAKLVNHHAALQAI